jgi:phosphoribosyl-AMP cyclohydrolase
VARRLWSPRPLPVQTHHLADDHEGAEMQNKADNSRDTDASSRTSGAVADSSIVKYDSRGLVPCIVQEWNTGEVLMLAYMNAESLRRTLESGTTWFYSRSRQEYWNKGATSGHFQKVHELRYDCDADTLLCLVDRCCLPHRGFHLFRRPMA